jgi:hypothetical protein
MTYDAADPKVLHGLSDIVLLTELPNEPETYAFTFKYQGHSFRYDGRVVWAEVGEFHPRYMIWSKVGKARWPEGKSPTRQEAKDALHYHIELACDTILKKHEEWSARADTGEIMFPWGES